MGTHHHHIASKNILSLEDLREQFGDIDACGAKSRNDIIGERYLRLLAELNQIVVHQWRTGVRRGLVKGFLLSGPPGTGKTTLAKRLAYELCLQFGGPDDNASVVLAFIDGAEVARSRYGESEERILDLFAHAKAGFTAAGQRSVILFDDVESIFMARGSQHAKEWHFSQDSVFFHSIDELDTSRTVVVLTTNRPDLVDDAIRDRFLTYHVDYPDAATLIQVAMHLASQQQFPPDRLGRLEAHIREAITANSVRSLRDAQRVVVQQYVKDLLGAPSLAQTASLPPG
jgi:SpoVK/Ycf46/Vps4 family AAA+-type ATPase